MQRIHLITDIRPLSEFAAHSARFIQQLRQTHRPVVLTEEGESAAVVLSVEEYERLVEELETLRDIHTAQRQLDQDGGIPHNEAKARLLARIRR